MSGTVEERMARAVEAFGKDLGGFRTGRASASLVEHITVDHYGAKTPLNQMAGISVPEGPIRDPSDREGTQQRPARHDTSRRRKHHPAARAIHDRRAP
jgi:hypothetical protein